MKEVTRHQSDNGKLFLTEKDAKREDEIYHTADKLIRSILPKNQPVGFCNGKGYYQLNQKQVKDFTEGFIEAVEKFYPSTAKEAKVRESPNGFVGRYLDDGKSALYSVWITLDCIDRNNRLWGQPFYAIHPERGEQIKLN
jgi:hypothetical protein